MRYDEKPSLDEYIYNMYSDAELTHYGTKMHSGRYPWGSGDEPYQHSGDFVAAVKRLKKEGLSEVKIAEHFGMKTGDFRNEYRAANIERRYLQAQQARSLKEDGLNTYEIGRKMNIAESTVRELLDPNKNARYNKCKNTYNFLKDQFREHKFIDIGEGVERDLGISREMLDASIHMLKMEGYEVYERHAPTNNPTRNITVKTLCPPGTTFQDFISSPLDSIGSVTDFTSKNNGESFEQRKPFVYPKSMDISRLQVRYADDVDPDGVKGIEKDGLIELRRGVDDLSLGNSKISQVRILVDNDRYLKGMAVYSDNMPDGVDVVFNTNKTRDKPVRDVLKKIEDDADNPFGSTIKEQVYYKDKNGKEQLGLINKRADEGDWEDWSNTLPHQFLAKQNIPLIKKQINESYEARLKEYNDICALENPTVKKALLKDFAEGCDSASVHLKAAALPRQQYHVIIPIGTLKDNEIFAPNYNDGEELALIRYPHAGLFEIPKLKVNNKNPLGKKIIGLDSVDAVGINSRVAEQLSGADFDGDTVMVIPTNDKVKISNSKPLKELKGFDPKIAYATNKGDDGNYYDDYGHKVDIMPEKAKQKQMGMASNLITDMTLAGASDEEMARACKHAYVVIDAPKHKLDWKRSEVENGIKQLKEKYQLRYDEETGKWKAGGASTILSRAKSPVRVLKRQGTPSVNKKGTYNYDPSKPEGALIYKTADDAYYAEYIKDKDNPGNIKYKLYDGGTTPSINKKNKEEYDYYKPVKKTNPDTGEVYFTNKTGELRYNVNTNKPDRPAMSEVADANELVSPRKHPKELIYADYANKLKALANQARKEDVYTSDMKYNPSANKMYKETVKDLLDRLNEVSKNQTRERQANLLASAVMAAKIQDNPGLKENKGTVKKMHDQALKRARETVGAKRRRIEITDKDWEAIQAGAISADRLKKIFKYTDMDAIRQKAMPKPTTVLTKTQTNKIEAMVRTGRYTNKQIADAIGVSVSTIYEYMKGDK